MHTAGFIILPEEYYNIVFWQNQYPFSFKNAKCTIKFKNGIFREAKLSISAVFSLLPFLFRIARFKPKTIYQRNIQQFLILVRNLSHLSSRIKKRDPLLADPALFYVIFSPKTANFLRLMEFYAVEIQRFASVVQP